MSCITCRKSICDLYLLPYSLPVTCIPSSEILTESLAAFFFTFSCITLMSLLPNPQNKAFSITMFVRLFLNKIENHLLLFISSLQEFISSFHFFSTICIECFTFNIINFSLLLTHSLHFCLVVSYFFSKIFAAFFSTFSNLQVMFLKVKCRQQSIQQC